MWELVSVLVPEMLGLVITPAAVVACLLLLGSPHPLRNVTVFGGVFLAVYGAVSAVVLVVGRDVDATSGADASNARGAISTVVGVLFLVAAGGSWVRRARRAAAGTEPGRRPGWVDRLADPPPGLLVAAGLVLAIANPNIAILASGLGIVMTADVEPSQQVVGVLLLLLSSSLDFVVPSVIFAVAGPRGRAMLRRLTAWLIEHDATIGIVVLLAFGLLFTARGLAQLLA